MDKNSTNKTKVIVILGPTSSGKSAVAIFLAKKFDGEIISADSRQIYRDMDLGTGKVEGEWREIQKDSKAKAFYSEGIPHHLLDFRSPRGEYNISHFKKDCELKIKEVAARGKLPIICGGTGFWIDAIVSGFVLPEVKPDNDLRNKLENKTTQFLIKKLQKLDTNRAKEIDQKNRVRIIRAIEIAIKLGKVPKLTSKQNPLFEFLQIGIDWPQKVLDEKIKKRLDNRWQAGMTFEVENLKQKYKLSWKKIQSFGLGYFWIPLFIKQKITEDELKERVFIAERGYAKRQRTWFSKNKDIIWENEQMNIKQIAKKFLE